MTHVLQLDDVSKQFRSGGLFSARTVNAVKHVSFTLDDDIPEVFAIVGQSGSGKSTLANMILGSEKPSSGSISVLGEDITDRRSGQEKQRFMSRVQPIFQNPFEAFNPLTRIDSYLFSTARRFRGARSRKDEEALSEESLQLVGLSMDEVRGRYSHELSGGQLQRIAVARALIPKPDLIIADEPVSMVDASLRMSIVNLFRELRDQLGVSIIYITHDLATAYYISDRLIIMKSGEIVESGLAKEVLDNPQHPYSRALKEAVLPPDPERAHEVIRLG
ncbi:ABC transporter ATP-binding protein [Qingshengfaniella alkalisoli]|uniref:ABC transporter ATP-binding protein n=1 Tax=Qingshengfaniella alkalisoli TaxID=2599296 RepID=A0A5B8IWK5_9RHOB|nr:ABC transporter ATP-binding protein [Qingshengfaniella alkalisoli]QDY70542.1 ABC transporter ATP-binding protein [Qingshengfaniella alkalisoli]